MVCLFIHVLKIAIIEAHSNFPVYKSLVKTTVGGVEALIAMNLTRLRYFSWLLLFQFKQKPVTTKTAVGAYPSP